jgi:hypothetical protein
MLSKRGRHAAAITSGLVALVALGGEAALADPLRAWSGRSGPYSWEAKQLTCGVAEERRSTLREHTRWRTSPSNGYHRVTLVRQVRAEGAWHRILQRRWSTRNTHLEGSRTVVHWSQWYQPGPTEGGRRARYRLTFEWLRERSGPDRVVFRRRMTVGSCVVRG